MTTSATAKIVFDPLSADFARDPYPAYAALRDHDGPWYWEAGEMWLLSRFADVQAAAVNPKLVRTLDGIRTPGEIEAERRRANWHDMPNHSRFVQFSLLDSDGDVHQRLRRRLFGEFTHARIQGLRAEVEAHVDRLMDDVAGRGTFDFIEDFAAHVPGHIIGRLLGVPDEDCAILRIWSENIVQYFDVDRGDARKALAEGTTTEFYHYLLALSDARRRAPKDDLLSRLVAAHDAGELSEDEYISTCMLILMAGHGSTIDVLGTGLHALLRFPDAMQRLRDDGELMAAAVQEMFRFESPLPFFHRYAAESIEINGFTVGKGAKIGLLYGCANRDDAAFDDAARFDVGRTPNRHLAFGGGAHFCLGNHLARMEMEIIFIRLLRRFSRIELAQAPVYKPGLAVRGVQDLRLFARPA
jgi:cytochrome P450